jgi:hypothetical protein
MHKNLNPLRLAVSERHKSETHANRASKEQKRMRRLLLVFSEVPGLSSAGSRSGCFILILLLFKSEVALIFFLGIQEEARAKVQIYFDRLPAFGMPGVSEKTSKPRRFLFDVSVASQLCASPAAFRNYTLDFTT